MKKINKAIGLFEDILKDNPINSICTYGLGNCYYELEEYETAILYFKKVVETENEDNSDAYNKLGKYDLAVETAIKAIDINKNDVYSICTLAEAYENLNELDISKRLFENCLKIEPNFQDAIDGLKRIKEIK